MIVKHSLNPLLFIGGSDFWKIIEVGIKIFL